MQQASRNSSSGGRGCSAVGAMGMVVAGAGVLCAPSPSFFLSSFPFFIFYFSNVYIGCGEKGHGMLACSEIIELTSKGLITRDGSGRIVNKNGTTIRLI